MFVDRMPDCHSPKHLAILRAKAGKSVVGLLAGKPVQAMTHWYKGKTFPCPGSEHLKCPICELGVTKRYYAYHPLRSSKGSAAAVELTATAEALLLDCLANRPNDCLVLMTVSRKGGKRNNPLHVDCEFRPVSQEEYANFYGKMIDQDLLKRALCRLWNVPEWEPGVNQDEFEGIVCRYLRSVVKGDV